MEQLNRIELKGHVGQITLTRVQDKTVANMSVATDFIYKDRNGEMVIETTWHRVIAWEGEKTLDITRIEKGDAVHVTGRLRSRNITTQSGETRAMYETLANEVSLIQKSE